MHSTIILVWLAIVLIRALSMHNANSRTGDTTPIGEPMPEPMPPPYGISV